MPYCLACRLRGTPNNFWGAKYVAKESVGNAQEELPDVKKPMFCISVFIAKQWEETLMRRLIMLGL